jgi:hypothetical protein
MRDRGQPKADTPRAHTHRAEGAMEDPELECDHYDGSKRSSQRNIGQNAQC